MTAEFDYALLADPQVFALNRLPPHSDHVPYANAAEMAAGCTSLRQSLNGKWRFNFAHGINAIPQGFANPSFDSSAWDFITVPGHFETQGYGIPQYTNKIYPWEGYEDCPPGTIPQRLNVVGTYLTTFDKPQGWNNAFICFEGADSALAVWLNGHFVGYSEDTFTPSYFDLNPYLQDKDNYLAVQVFKYSSGSHLEDQDYWRLSGLFRGVYLYTKPTVHLEDLKVTTTLDDSFSQGKLQATLTTLGSGKVVATLSFAGTEIATTTQDLATPTLSFAVDTDLKLWSAEEPNLYTLNLEFYDAAGVLQECVCQNVGFRRFEMKDGLMTLNGQRIVFNGVNRHEFAAQSGRCLQPEEIYADLLACKRYNINAVRTSHYPNSSCFYDYCDKLGLYVIDETNMETHGSWEVDGNFDLKPNTLPDDKPQWREAVLARGAAMLERDKNHACILIWSCGNESFGGKTVFELSEYFRHTDPSRLVHYESIFHDRRYNDTSDMESQMYSKVADVKAFIAAHPEKPFILCEYSHAMGNSCGGLKHYTDMTHELPRYQGGFIWDFCDQAFFATDPTGHEYLAYGGDFGDRQTDYNFSGNGIFFADRKPTPKLAEVKACYQNFKFDFIPGADKEDLAALKVKITNYFLFTNLDAFKLQATVEVDGKQVQCVTIPATLAAGESAEFALGLANLPTVAPAATVTVNVAVIDVKERAWAPAGYSIANAQFIVKLPTIAPLCSTKAPRLIITANNCGVHGEGFSYLINKDKGGLVSMKYNQSEMLLQPAQLNFWRAPTDNDRGNRMPTRLGIWRRAGQDARTLSMQARMENNQAVIELTHELAGIADAKVVSCYRIDANGCVEVTLSYQAGDNLPDLPEFGLILPLRAEYQHLCALARGPEENYCDRDSGTPLCAFKSTVAKQYVPYLKPQECGNHQDVVDFKILNRQAHGLCVKAGVDLPAVSVLAWTPHEIELASHQYELPPVVKTVVKIAKRPMGVGGDDSWGAPTLEQYLNHNQDYTFTFRLQVQ